MKKFLTIIFALILYYNTYSTNFDSVDEKTGLWSESTTWTSPSKPTDNIGVNDKVFINGTITSNTDISFSNNAVLNIEAEDTLIINGYLTLATGTDIIIGGNAVLLVTGDLSGGNNFLVNATGKIIVMGNFTVAVNPTISVPPNFLYILGTNNIPSGSYSQDDIGTREELLGDPSLTTFVESIIGYPLPVELIEFNGIYQHGIVIINWKTATETNNNFFEIMKSINGIDFSTIYVEQGQGTTTVEHSYEFKDENIEEKLQYYKLSQTDFDGKSSESKIISVKTTSSIGKFIITDGYINVIPNEEDHDYFIIINDSEGSVLFNKSFSGNSSISKSNLKPGVYYLTIINEHGLTSTKFIIK